MRRAWRPPAASRPVAILARFDRLEQLLHVDAVGQGSGFVEVERGGFGCLALEVD